MPLSRIEMQHDSYFNANYDPPGGVGGVPDDVESPQPVPHHNAFVRMAPPPATTSPPLDFSSAVDQLLGRTENIIQVTQTTHIEAATLKQLLQMLSRKIQLQQMEMEKQAQVIDELRQEVYGMSAKVDGLQSARTEARRWQADAERADAERRQQARVVEQLRNEVEDLRVEMLRFASQSRAAAHGRSAVSSAGNPPLSDANNIVAVAGGSRATTPVSSSRGVAGSGGSTSRAAPPPGAMEGMLSPSRGTATGQSLSSAPIGAPPASFPPSAAPVTSQSSRPVAGFELTETPTGVRVSALKTGGAAEEAGLLVGDTILRTNGTEIRSKSDFITVLERSVPGQCLDVAYRRDGASAMRIAKMYLGVAPSRPK